MLWHKTMKRHPLRSVRASLLTLLTALALVLQCPQAWAQSMTSPIGALRASATPRARVRAVQEIARTHPDGGREALESALRDRAPNVRRAAAISLGEFGDRSAISALNTVLDDRDRSVRSAAQASVRALSSLPAQPVGARPSNAYGTGSYGGTGAFGSVIPQGYGASAPAAAVTAAPAQIDWRRVRMVVSVNNVQNRASSTASDTETMRQSLRQAIQSAPGLALHTGTLPAVAQSRLRARTLRWCALEGSLAALRRTQDAAGVHVRAELSLAILQEPAHNIIGTVNTSASASEQVFPGGTDPTARLSQAAIEVAARGAVQRLQDQFGAAPAGRRRR